MDEDRAAFLRMRIRELEYEVRVTNEVLRDRKAKLTLAKNELFELTYHTPIWWAESARLMERDDAETV